MIFNIIYKIIANNYIYRAKGDLHLEKMGRGFAWLDTGTHESLLEASVFVEIIERRQGYKIGCLEEIAWNNGWLSRAQILKNADPLSKNSYGQYLANLVNKGKTN